MFGLRTIFSAFLVGTVLFGLVVIFSILGAKDSTEPPQYLVIWVMLGIGVVLQLVVAKVERPLDTSSQASLSASYRGRCIIRAAVAEGASLAGLVAALVAVQLWAVPLTVLVTVYGWVRAAPTEAAIRRDDERLQSQGSPTSLTATLWSPTPSNEL